MHAIISLIVIFGLLAIAPWIIGLLVAMVGKGHEAMRHDSERARIREALHRED